MIPQYSRYKPQRIENRYSNKYMYTHVYNSTLIIILIDMRIE